MTDNVNPIGEGATLRQAQTALTEERILAAATELFLADGYVATIKGGEITFDGGEDTGARPGRLVRGAR